MHMAINGVAGGRVYHVWCIVRESGLRTLKPKNLKKSFKNPKKLFFLKNLGFSSLELWQETAMVGVGNSSLGADWRSMSVGLVWRSAATWRWFKFIRWTVWSLAMIFSWWQHAINIVSSIITINSNIFVNYWPPAKRRVLPPRSTQPCIPPGSLNRVLALAGVKAGKSPLPGGR